MLTISAYDTHVEQLFEVVERLAAALEKAGMPYRVVGGLAVFLHVSDRDPVAARVTRDIDLLVNRADLEAIVKAAAGAGFECRHAGGVDMLVDAQQPKARSAVHFICAREKVRPEHAEPAPDLSTPAKTSEGLLLAPVADLVRMKLTSFRLKDQVHIQDMDSVGLITPDIESALSETLRERLRQVRESE